MLDTGIGRDGYSVIGQGRIARSSLPKAWSGGRIFEEACGIAKYRYRKTEAERRLAAAGENLERLRDILGELEARVGPLERDSAKAKQFLALSAQRKTLELTLWSDTIRQAKEAIRCCTRDYETAQAQYQQYDQQAAAAEQEAEEDPYTGTAADHRCGAPEWGYPQHHRCDQRQRQPHCSAGKRYPPQ